MDPRAQRLALMLGLVAIGAVIVLRRAVDARAAAVGPAGAGAALPADIEEFGPLAFDAGPLEIDAGPFYLEVPQVPAPAASVLDRVSMFLGDAVDSVKRALLPRGMRNNNPGNLRTLPADRAWRGQVGDDGGGYAVYDLMQHGVRATGRQLLSYQRRGLETVRGIISTWAPASENDTGAYVASVARALALTPDDRFDIAARLPALAAAIFAHENGAPFTSYANPGTGRDYSAAEIERWVRL